MDATGRLVESLMKRIGPLERGGMLENTNPRQGVRFASTNSRITSSSASET
jgi:hypothetical protein